MALDPDKLLQRLVNSMSSEERRIRANIKANCNGTIYSPDGEVLLTNQPTCQMCRRDFGMSDSQRKWLVEATKVIASIAMGARKMVSEKLLKSLSEGGLAAYADAMGQREKDSKWLPEM